MTNQIEVNGVYTGEVTKVLDFGAFVEIAPGVEGLLHVSQIAEVRIAFPKDVLEVGSEVTVKCIEFEGNKKVRLTMKEQPQHDSDVAKKLEKIIAEGGAKPPRKDNRRPRRDGDKRNFRGGNSRNGDRRGGFKGKRDGDSRNTRDGGSYRGKKDNKSRNSKDGDFRKSRDDKPRSGGSRNFGSGEKRNSRPGDNRKPKFQGRRLNRS